MLLCVVLSKVNNLEHSENEIYNCINEYLYYRIILRRDEALQ